MEQFGGGNELLDFKSCSPMLVYVIVLVVSGLSVFITRNHLQKHATHKMDNLFNLYSLHELKFAVVMGAIMYGLCQHNQTNLAWIFLIFPIIYIIVQNIVIHIHVSSAVQSAPKEIEQIYEQPALNGANVIPQESKVSYAPPIPPTMAAMKQTPDIRAASTLGGISGNSVQPSGSLSGPSNFSIF